MKTIVSALAGASLLAAALPAVAADSHHGGSWGGRGSAPSAGAPSSGGFAGSVSGGFHGGFRGGSFAGRPGFNGHAWGGHFHGRGFPYYGAAGFGLGLALGLSAYDPWYYDAPYYAYYAPYPGGYYYPAPAYGPPPPGAPPVAGPSTAPSAGSAQPPAAACGSWAWDTAKQVYNWVPCAE